MADIEVLTETEVAIVTINRPVQSSIDRASNRDDDAGGRRAFAEKRRLVFKGR